MLSSRMAGTGVQRKLSVVHMFVHVRWFPHFVGLDVGLPCFVVLLSQPCDIVPRSTQKFSSLKELLGGL